MKQIQIHLCFILARDVIATDMCPLPQQLDHEWVSNEHSPALENLFAPRPLPQG